MNSFDNNIFTILYITICTEINNRILHFADQNVVPNIANGTSPQFYNNVISCFKYARILHFDIYLYLEENWTGSRPCLNLVL